MTTFSIQAQPFHTFGEQITMQELSLPYSFLLFFLCLSNTLKIKLKIALFWHNNVSKSMNILSSPGVLHELSKDSLCLPNTTEFSDFAHVSKCIIYQQLQPLLICSLLSRVYYLSFIFFHFLALAPTCKKAHAVFTFLCPAYFTQNDVNNSIPCFL